MNRELCHASDVQDPCSTGPWISTDDDSTTQAHGVAYATLDINLVYFSIYVEDKLLYPDNGVISWRGRGHLSDALVEVLSARPEVLHVHVLTPAQH